MGLFVTPWIVLVAREALRARRWVMAVLCGLLLVALLHIHGSEIYFVAVLTLIAVLPGHRPKNIRCSTTGAASTAWWPESRSPPIPTSVSSPP